MLLVAINAVKDSFSGLPGIYLKSAAGGCREHACAWKRLSLQMINISWPSAMNRASKRDPSHPLIFL